MASGKPKGLAIPFQMSAAGYPVASEGVDTLAGSIRTILLTTPGERVYRPDFGSWLRRIVFANMDVLAQNQVRSEIARAIAQWEPRVTILDMTFQQQDTTLSVLIKWRPVASNTAQQTTTLTFEV